MKQIGLLSDTHGFIDERIYHHFKNCDEIWHAGDIGVIQTADTLASFKPFIAVYGNIDSHDVRLSYPETQRFITEGIDIFIKHIGGYPDNYDKSIKNYITLNPPGLFISGHSHILKIQYDKKLGLLHINPGSSGKTGLHKVRTIVRFYIDKTKIRDLEIIELGKR